MDRVVSHRALCCFEHHGVTSWHGQRSSEVSEAVLRTNHQFRWSSALTIYSPSPDGAFAGVAKIHTVRGLETTRDGGRDPWPRLRCTRSGIAMATALCSSTTAKTSASTSGALAPTKTGPRRSGTKVREAERASDLLLDARKRTANGKITVRGNKTSPKRKEIRTCQEDQADDPGLGGTVLAEIPRKIWRKPISAR